MADTPAPMTLDEIGAATRAALDTCLTFNDGTVSAQRTKAIEYFQGIMRDLPAPDGRSKAMTTDVRDTVLAQLPSLMKVFYGSEEAVEFRPRGPEDVPAARQATEYVNYVLNEDNPGFLILRHWIEDALVQSEGVVTWWWEPIREATTEVVTGLVREQVLMLEQAEDVSFQVLAQHSDGTFDLEVTRLVTTGRVRVRNVPPEDFFRSPVHPTLRESPIVACRWWVTDADLRAMGFDDEQIGTGADDYQASDETQARLGTRDDTALGGAVTPSMRRRGLFECLVLLDTDGDGIATRRRVYLLGGSRTPLREEPADDVNFALLIPHPTPHTSIGLGTADLTMDLQRLKTATLRAAMDDLAMALNPRTAAVTGMVNLNDAMNTEIGALIRVEQPGMLQELVHEPQVGNALAMLGYHDSILERRTGIERGAAGLDADALQSTTKGAVDAVVSGKREHLDLLARTFAETGIKDLFKGLLRLIVQHQDVPRMVRLRNQFVPVDPRTWDATMDVQVNVALGYGSTEDKLLSLGAIQAKQEMILQTMGLANPFVTPERYAYSLHEMTRLGGWKNTDAFWQRTSDQQLAQQAAQQPPPPPSPEQVIAQAQVQIEQTKVLKDAALKEADLQFKREELAFRERDAARADDRERDKVQVDATLKAEELKLQYGTTIGKLQIDRAKVEQQDAAKQQDTARAREAEQHAAQEADKTRTHQEKLATVKQAPKATKAKAKSGKRTITVQRGKDGKIAGATVSGPEETA